MFQHLETKPIWEVIDAIRGSSGLHAKCQLFGILLKREGPNYDVNGLTGMIKFYLITCFCVCSVCFTSGFVLFCRFSGRTLKESLPTSLWPSLLDSCPLLQQSTPSHC